MRVAQGTVICHLRFTASTPVLVDTSQTRLFFAGDHQGVRQEGNNVPSAANQASAKDLRLHLRAATMAAHDLLDQTMQAASGWHSLEDYARFLKLQYAARLPVEQWLEVHAPDDLRPPKQAPLIAHDLAVLKLGIPPPAAPFCMPATTPSMIIGAAWVLAGSALGNRSILKQMRRASAADDCEWPSAFLGDEAMLVFWQALRERIERPATMIEASAAAHGASAVFAHFTSHAQTGRNMTSGESLSV